MNINPVTWFEIFVNDITRAHAFYEAILDITLEPQNQHAGEGTQMRVFPNAHGLPGSGGALVQRVGDEIGDGGANVLMYFSCDDCNAVLDRVLANGGRVLKEKYSIGSDGYIATATDNEGNIIGLHSMH